MVYRGSNYSWQSIHRNRFRRASYLNQPIGSLSPTAMSVATTGSYQDLTPVISW